jgi:hypothetical protein
MVDYEELRAPRTALGRLETGRVCPGHWLVEGHDVKRVVYKAKGIPNETVWQIRQFGQLMHVTPTLRQACEWIEELRHSDA